MPKSFQDNQDESLPVDIYNVEELLDLLSEGVDALDTEKIRRTPPHIIASFLNRLSVDDCRSILRKIPDLNASEILAEMDAEASADIVSEMREWRALKILEEVEPDDAADIISELEEPDRVRLLSKLEPETASKVRALLKYDPDTAGGVMTPDFISVPDSFTVDQAIERVRSMRDTVRHSSYIYVVDAKRKLVGVFSMRALILAEPGSLISSIMETDLKGVCSPQEDREHIARYMSELNLYDLPVVDEKGRMLGIVEHDDIIDIIQEEATEDFQKLVGAGPDEAIHDPISYSLRKRGPWLLVNLITGFMAAGVISAFQSQIESITVLAVLMPLVASLGGNTGAQTLAVAIRSIAMGDIETFDDLNVCFKEGLKGVINGIVVGLVTCGVIYFFTHDLKLSLVILLAMTLNMGVGGLFGAFIPLMLKRLGLDPAQSSSIFLTGTTDVCGFFIFLSLATWLLF